MDGTHEPSCVGWLVLILHWLGPTLQGPSFDCPIPFPYSSLKRRGTTGLELHGGEQDGGLTER